MPCLHRACAGLACAVQAEVARVKAEAAAEVLAASQRATAGAEAGTTEPDGCDTAAQKAHLERTVAELRAALSAQDKDMENRLRYSRVLLISWLTC